MKKALKIIALVSVTAIIGGLVGCSSPASPSPAATTSATVSAEPSASPSDTSNANASPSAGALDTKPLPVQGSPVKVTFICADMANESQAYSSRCFTKYAPNYGLQCDVLDAKGDAQTETQCVQNAVAQGSKAIYVNPNDIHAIVPALAAAHKAGVLVGMFSSDLAAGDQANRDFFCGVNDTEAGKDAADAFIKQFPNGANIVEVGGQAGHDAQIKRHDGFNNEIKGTNIKVIDYKACQQWDTSQAQTIMEDMITKEGPKIQGVFCHWDNGATGCINALKAANMTGLFLVAIDGCKAGFDQVNAGDQSVCIMQNFDNMTMKELQCTQAALYKQPFNAINFIPLDIITKDNISQYPMPQW